MAQSNACEVWVCVDNDGNYAVGVDADAARAAFDDTIGTLGETDGHRMVKLVVDVPLPTVVELSGAAPAQGTAKLTSVAHST